jgi:cellulase/cellobiase CelA1
LVDLIFENLRDDERHSFIPGEIMSRARNAIQVVVVLLVCGCEGGVPVRKDGGSGGSGGISGSGGGTSGTGGSVGTGGSIGTGGSDGTGGSVGTGGGNVAGGTATGGGSNGTGGGAVNPSPMRVDNPYSGAVGYVNEDWSSKARGEANQQSGALKAAMLKVAAQPSFVWFDRIAAIAGSASVKGLRAHLDAALAQQNASGSQVVFQMVVYDLPNRDCNALASNGELKISTGGMTRYKGEYIDPMAAILKDAKYATLRVVALIEVDSLPNLITNLSVPKCSEANGPGGYVEGVTYALNKLSVIPNVYNYIDVAHSGWLGWDDNRTKAVTKMKEVVMGTSKGWDSVAGFASNSANYTPLEETNLPDSNLNIGGQPVKSSSYYEYNPHFDELDFVTALRDAFVSGGAPARLGMLIDTGRNGWGGPLRPAAASGTSVNAYVNSGRVDRRNHRGNWCNQALGGVGERPTAAPKPGIHAYVWVKPPGESDGIATPTPGGPNADGKQHDPMCSPTFNGAGGTLTGAMPGAPHAGDWFAPHFKSLVENAFPPL